MIDAAPEILDYLPLEAGAEAPYIQHLWKAFEVLVESDEPAMPFAIMPYHLLFMFAVQFKVYRVSAWDHAGYLGELANCRIHGTHIERDLLKTNAPIPGPNGFVSADSSVRKLSRTQEDHLFRLLRPIQIEQVVVDRATALVTRRAQYAHANGNIEQDLEAQVAEYLAVLSEIQPKMLPLNDATAAGWQTEIALDELVENFVQTRLSTTFLCANDFRSGQLAALYGQTLQDAGII